MAKKYYVNIDLQNANKVVNSTSPSADGDLANKAYVDGVARGLKWKESVRARTTGNITIATALNSGDSIDGVTLADGDRVLVDNQTTATEDGIYVVSGSPARSADLPVASNATGIAVTVTEGTANGDKVFIQTADPAVVGTDGLTFTQLGGAGSTYTAGSGLTESPAGTFNVGAGNGITVNADDVALAAGAAGAGLTYTTGVLAVGAGTGITVNADDVAVNTSVVGRVVSETGSGTGTSYTVTHNLGKQWVKGVCHLISSEEEVEVDIVATDTNNTAFTFGASQTLSNFRFTVIG